ncbi:histidine kinase, partial [Vibrio parahaemolyticus]|nr:histidine kinase [Vibrio parahaemolyticus]
NHMPVLDGVGAISAIRAMSSPAKSVLIFGCTADVFKETQERMINVGADHIIAKPIVESELNDALYLHATQLYQYQSDFDGNAADSFNAEKWLLNFYVALDNGHLNEALEAISAIIAEAPLELSGDVSSVAERIRSNLKRQQSPDQDDIDTLTILLASP